MGIGDTSSGGEDVYKGKVESMLVLLSDSYSNDEEILVM